ncbi:hypothetical protein RJT34_16064 [Clitoria ternatea]|uniref:Uncharacterized protein n=1 Tax=Clitoria ternatea TaxID=43366 RepID=A0AAN9J7S7_CLITE
MKTERELAHGGARRGDPGQRRGLVAVVDIAGDGGLGEEDDRTGGVGRARKKICDALGSHCYVMGQAS